MPAHVVWLNHKQGKAFTILSADELLETSVQAPPSAVPYRPHDFFNGIAALIKDTDGFLIVGPCLAKHLLTTHLAEHFPKLFRKIVACEQLEHPTQPSIRALAARLFQYFPQGQ